MTAAAGPPSRPRRRRWAVAAQAVVVAVAFAFLVATLYEGREELAAALTRPGRAGLGAVVAAALVASALAGLGWAGTLRALGGRLRVVHALPLFLVAELGKYLPGMLWATVGRAEGVVRHGVGRPVGYASVLLAVGLNYVLAAPLAAALVAPAVLAHLLASPSAALLLVLVLPLGLAALHPAAQRMALSRLERVSAVLPVLPWRTGLGLALLHLPVWVAVTAATAAAAAVLGVALDAATVGMLAIAAALSWTAGFLVLPAPAGLGVREAVFVLLAGPTVGVDTAAALAVLTRLGFVAADGVGAGAGLLALRGLSRRGAGASEARR